MKEEFNLVGGKKCQEVLKKYNDYKVFWMSGFAWKGASESEDDKQDRVQYVWQEGRNRLMTFGERMKRRYDWSAAIDIEIDHDAKEIHFNGFSENDMF